VSPDGDFVVSASSERAIMPLLGTPGDVTLARATPFAACVDVGGNVYILDLVGIEYGPIIVTAVDFGSGPLVRCPFCLAQLALHEDWLGEDVDCAEPGCEGRMRVNPFVV
jgi:hypothetical protein